jgi:DNA-binding response OmpR family regulator
MITAYGDAETKRRALEGGAEALLTKPIDFVMLRSEIDTRVERSYCDVTSPDRPQPFLCACMFCHKRRMVVQFPQNSAVDRGAEAALIRAPGVVIYGQ